MPAFHLLSSRCHVLTFQFRSSEYQFTFTTQELSYPAPSIALPIEYSQGCIVLGASKPSSSRIPTDYVCFERRECTLPQTVAGGIPAFSFPKSPPKAVTVDRQEFQIQYIKRKSSGPSDKVSKGPRIKSAYGGQSEQESVSGRRHGSPHPTRGRHDATCRRTSTGRRNTSPRPPRRSSNRTSWRSHC